MLPKRRVFETERRIDPSTCKMFGIRAPKKGAAVNENGAESWGRRRLAPQTVLEQIDRSVRYLLQTSPELRGHLREARLSFEAGMVRLAAHNAKASDVTSLQAALERQRAAVGDAAQFVAADIAFHNAIAAISGNPIYVAVSQALLQWVFELFPRLLRVPGVEDVTLQEHESVLNAIAAHDEDLATRVLAAHLLRSNPLYESRGAKARKSRNSRKGS